MDEDQVQGNSGEEIPVTDAEIVDDTSIPVSSGDATVLTSLDEMIKTYVVSIDRIQAEFRKQKEMLEDAYSNDPVYRENAEQAKLANKKKSETKAQITKQPGMLAIANKVRTMAAELKEKRLSLSDYLLEYQRLSGANQIEVDNGEILEIVNSARIIRKSSK